MITEETEDCIINYEESESPEMKDKVFQLIKEWFFGHEKFDREGICQYSGFNDAKDLMADIAEDVFKMKILEWKKVRPAPEEEVTGECPLCEGVMMNWKCKACGYDENDYTKLGPPAKGFRYFTCDLIGTHSIRVRVEARPDWNPDNMSEDEDKRFWEEVNELDAYSWKIADLSISDLKPNEYIHLVDHDNLSLLSFKPLNKYQPE